MLVVIATMRAREDKEDRLRDVLTALVVESRLERGCQRFDLFMGQDDSREFALYEEWESESAFNAHLRSRHIAVGYSLAPELTEGLPKVMTYRLIEPPRRFHTGPTRPLGPDEAP